MIGLGSDKKQGNKSLKFLFRIAGTIFFIPFRLPNFGNIFFIHKSKIDTKEPTDGIYCVSKDMAWPYFDSCLSLKSAKIIDKMIMLY